MASDNPLLAYMNADDEPTANEQAAAMAAALRRRKDIGLLASLSGGRLAGPGAAFLGDAKDGEQALMHAQVARTARLDRQAEKQQAALRWMAEQASKAKENAVDNQRAERAIDAQLANAAAMRAMAGASFGLRQHEVGAADRQRELDAQHKAEEQVRQLGAVVGDSPRLVAEKAARLAAALNQYKPGELPGFGTFKSYAPDSMVSDEGRGIRSDARELVNTLLFLQSGAGVSNQERENKYNAYGIGKGSSEQSFREGFARLRSDLAAALATKQAAFPREAVKTFKERGGVVPEDINPPPKLSPEDEAALRWAQDPKNANDPRAQAILQTMGAK